MCNIPIKGRTPYLVVLVSACQGSASPSSLSTQIVLGAKGYCLGAEPSCIGISTCHFLYKESDPKSLSLSQLVRVHSPLSLVTTIQTTPAPINQYKHT